MPRGWHAALRRREIPLKRRVAEVLSTAPDRTALLSGLDWSGWKIHVRPAGVQGSLGLANRQLKRSASHPSPPQDSACREERGIGQMVAVLESWEGVSTAWSECLASASDEHSTTLLGTSGRRTKEDMERRLHPAHISSITSEAGRVTHRWAEWPVAGVHFVLHRRSARGSVVVCDANSFFQGPTWSFE